MKTRELTGGVLDWAVAKCERFDNGDWLPDYSTDWAAGGPIIEQERITVTYADAKQGFMAMSHDAEVIAFGPTYLVAAMRCYVVSKLGDDAEIPD